LKKGSLQDILGIRRSSSTQGGNKEPWKNAQ
jgi:hypothetical protein